MYEYDSIYDDMERKKKEVIMAKKNKEKDQKVRPDNKAYGSFFFYKSYFWAS